MKQETERALPEFLILGMLPWNYSQLSDSVRSMVQTMPNDQYIYINPQADQRSLAWTWRVRQKQGFPEIWDPPFNIVPTRFGGANFRDFLSSQLLAAHISKRLGADWRDRTIVYVTASTLEQSYEYATKLQPKRLVFDILDDNLGFPGISEKKQKALQKKFLELARQAEVITAVSEYLVQQTEQLTGKKVEYLPNGVDVKHFSPKQQMMEPVDLQAIPRPRLMFVGAVTSWIDTDLLKQVAERNSHQQLVMIGPVFEMTSSLAALQQLPNVHFLGPKPYERVPDYLHGADVLLLPRTYDPHSLACDPLKLYEYMVTGKPVVSTAHPSVRRFSEVVWIGQDTDQFVTGIEQALAGTEERTIRQLRLVGGMSWESRMQRLKQLLTA
ncbi:glycosyltransferase [Fodinisporobacter ferrooxydans]|uniref:Glycosyltransferase n=1 Tax=Fodinisporobacter ferrooxydans TaxID=2901836 RepID=A0ABY4CIS0_9BACL|nr:glycosyltransferase [Alicyclobacillaceae bacterium MYW30-H2]